MSASAPLTLRARCRVTNLGLGEILFVGQTSFAAGTWVGVYLDEPRGKNDGSVQGKRYFSCEPYYGVFVRPSQVHMMDEDGMLEPSAAVSTPRSAAPLQTPVRSTQRSALSTPRSMHTTDRRSPVRSAPRTSLMHAQARLGTKPTSTTPVRTPPAAKTLPEATWASMKKKNPSPEPVLPQHTPSPEPDLPTSLLPTMPVCPPTPQRTKASEPVAPPSSQKAQDTQREQALEVRVQELTEALESAQTRISTLESDSTTKTDLTAALEAAKAQVAELQQAKEEGQTRMEELTEALEMATLDREMAEERTESLQHELQSVQATLTSLQEEKEAQQAADRAQIPDEELSLLEQNERLKEALLRLRDATQETEAAQRRELASLRADLAAHETLVSEHASLQEQWQRSEVLIQELRMQAEMASGAEDMLETLTERNMALEERVEQLTDDIQELETLRDVHEELEATHLETESQLQQTLQEREDRIAQLMDERQGMEASISSHNSTLEQFRALVAELARDRDEWRAKCHAPVAQAPAMPVSMPTPSAPTLVPSMRQLEQAQLTQHVAFLRAYVPASVADEAERSFLGVLAYERLARYADLASHAMAYDIPALVVERALEESVLRRCQARERVASVGARALYIAAVLRTAPVDTFLAHATDQALLMPQIQAWDKALQGWDDDDTTLPIEDTRTMLDQIITSLPSVTSVRIDAAQMLAQAWHTSATADTLLAHAGYAQQHTSTTSVRECVAVATRIRTACWRWYRRVSRLFDEHAMLLWPEDLATSVSTMASRLHDELATFSPTRVDASTSALATLRTLADDVEALVSYAHRAEAVQAWDAAPEGPWTAHATVTLAAYVETAMEAEKASWEAAMTSLRETAHAQAAQADAAGIKLERLYVQLAQAQTQAAQAADWHQQVETLQAQLASTTPTTAMPSSDKHATPPSVPTEYGKDTLALKQALQAVQTENCRLKASHWLAPLAHLPPLPHARRSVAHVAAQASPMYRPPGLAVSMPRVIEL